MSPRRFFSVPGAVALLAIALVVPPTAAVTPDWIPKDADRFVDITQADETAPPLDFKQVTPDKVVDLGSGRTIEVYTSVGNAEGGMDWRTVNLYAYLVNSVPKNKHSYSALFNSLYDGGQTIRYD